MANADAAGPKFVPGDAVAVRSIYPLGHVRTPYYIRGKRGVIERFCGVYCNPEELAYARSGLPKQPLYRGRFLQADVWPDYQGQAADTVDIEIYQHWLEPDR
ncbi:MAG: SH3-like domain-containing protein [Betaproteobacteria bacterium]